MTGVVMGWKRKELVFLLLYIVVVFIYFIHRTLQLAQEHRSKLYGLRPGWLSPHSLNDVSDAQWRNFRGNLPILTSVFALFAILANTLKAFLSLRAKGMSVSWILISLAYLAYLHGACTIYILLIASANYILVMIFARTKYFSFAIWVFNIFVLVCNRIYEGYSFSIFGEQWAYIDNFRGTFRWHICFNFVILRMISFGYDYHWAKQERHFDQRKHIQRCHTCKSGRICYQLLQERSAHIDNFSFSVYLSYLVYAPLYLAGPIISFNAFASQLDMPARIFATRDVLWYGLRWIFSFMIIEIMNHLFHYNAFAVSGLWKSLSPMDMFIITYGGTTSSDKILIKWMAAVNVAFVVIFYSQEHIYHVHAHVQVLNFMWLKFFLIWRYFRLWSLISGIEAPENMPRCINNCYNLESFWKNWHASYNRWLVRYIYIPLGGSKWKFLNIWVIFTFVAIWHDLEWKLLSWAWLTCLFFIPEMLAKSAISTLQAESGSGELLSRELTAVAGAITITCLMVANFAGYVVGPSGVSWIISRFSSSEGLPVLGWMMVTFYLAVKLILNIEDARR